MFLIKLCKKMLLKSFFILSLNSSFLFGKKALFKKSVFILLISG